MNASGSTQVENSRKCLPRRSVHASVSVAIVTYQDDRRLRRCLESLRNQTLTPEQLIVVDAAESASTYQLVSEFIQSASFSLQFISSEWNNLGYNRGLCVERCISNNIAFIDSDCEASPTWLEELVLSFDALRATGRPVAAVGGRVQLPSQGENYQALNLMHSHFLGHLNSPQARTFHCSQMVKHIPTNNVLYSVSAIKKIGNFSKEYGWVCEDVELSLRLRASGYQLWMVPQARLTHYTTVEVQRWSRKIFGYGYGQFLVIANQPQHLDFWLCLPLLFALVMTTSFGGALISKLWLILPMTHFLVLLALSLVLAGRQRLWHLTPLVSLYFLMTHYSYAFGEALGAFRWGLCKMKIGAFKVLLTLRISSLVRVLKLR